MFDQKAKENTTYVEKMQYGLAAHFRIFYISEQEIKKNKELPNKQGKKLFFVMIILGKTMNVNDSRYKLNGYW